MPGRQQWPEAGVLLFHLNFSLQGARLKKKAPSFLPRVSDTCGVSLHTALWVCYLAIINEHFLITALSCLWAYTGTGAM